MKVAEVVVSENQVVVMSTDSVVGLSKNKKGSNVLHFKAPTSKVGKEPAVKSFLSEDGLVKNSIIGLSDEAILDLHFVINQYVQDVLGVVVLQD